VSSKKDEGPFPAGRETFAAMYRTFLAFIWPKDSPHLKARVVIALSLLISSKLINVQVPIIFKYIIDSVSAIPMEASTIPLALLLGYGAARMSASLFNELRNAIFASVAQRAIQELAKKVFMHILNLDLAFHLNRQTGTLSRTLERGTKGITSVLNAMVFNVIPTIFEISLVCLILGMNFGAKFSGVTLICMATYAAFTLGITQWRTKFRKQMNAMENEASSALIDSLLNYETIKHFGNEVQEVKRYDNFLVKYNEAALKTQNSLALLNWGQGVIISSGMVAMMYMAANGVLDGTMTVGDLVMVNGLLFQLSIPLNFLGSVYRDTRQALIDMEAMFKLLSSGSTIQEKEVGSVLETGGKAVGISFENVTFSYDHNQPNSQNKNVLNNISFQIAPGKKVALVGPSGCGKSTIGKLLYRFYDPKSGVIKVNGLPLQDLTLKSLRSSIGIVPQDTVLFNDTIEYNIGYGDLSAPKERIHKVAELAQLSETISKMPNGYQTVVGERGLKISGGEKQRVAIARAILKNPSVLVFDEATSSLDSKTEQGILDSFKSLSVDKTTLIIAHRLSTIVDCDEIIVLSEGSVAERGTHNSLLSLPNGKYKQLWNAQLQASLAAVNIEEEKAAQEKAQKEKEKKTEERKKQIIVPVKCGNCKG